MTLAVMLTWATPLSRMTFRSVCEKCNANARELVCGYDSVMQTHMDLYVGGSLLCVVMMFCAHM